MRPMIWARALPTAAIALALFSQPAAHAQTQTPIKIGLPVSLTGPYGAEAQDQVKNAELAAKEFNQAGGLNGRMVQILPRDDRLNPAEAATRTLELIEKDNVDFIVGGLSAAAQLAINNVAKERKKIYVSISQSDTINEASDMSPYTFHEALTPHITTQAVGKYAFKPGDRIAFITADYAFGHEATRGFTRAAKAAGAQVVGEIRHPLGATDYSTFLPRIQSMRPTVLVFNNFGRDNQISIRQASDFGMKDSMKFVTPVLSYASRLAGGHDVYKDVIGGTSYYWAIEDTVPSAKALNDRYRAEFGSGYPSDYGSMAYSAVKSLLEAVKIAGTTDAEKVIPVLENLKYDTYKGPQHYRKCDHQSVQSILVITSKEKGKNASDVFQVLETIPGDESMLRTCAELGHQG